MSVVPAGQLAAAIDDANVENQVRHVVHRWLSCQEPTADANRDAHLWELLAPGAKIYRAFDGTSALEMQHLQVTDRGGGNVTAHVDVRTSGTAPRLVRADVELVSGDGQWFPRIGSVRNAGSTESLTAPARVNNRAAATMYAWLGLMDSAQVQPERARELVTEDTVITSSGHPPVTVANAGTVAGQVAAHPGRLAHSCHRVEDLEVFEDRDGWRLSMRLRCQAIAADGQAMVAAAQHHWQLREDGGRYARIAVMDIVVEDDLTPTTDVAALGQMRSST